MGFKNKKNKNIEKKKRKEKKNCVKYNHLGKSYTLPSLLLFDAGSQRVMVKRRLIHTHSNFLRSERDTYTKLRRQRWKKWEEK